MKQEKHDVLIVEDDDDIRNLMKIILSRQGYICRGISRLEIESIPSSTGLIILDVLLDDQNGKQVCAALRKTKEWKNTPILMVSALPEVEQACLTAGATAFLAKPFTIHAFTVCVQRLLMPGNH